MMQRKRCFDEAEAAAAAAAACIDLVVFYASATPLASNAMCHASAIS